MTPIERLQNYKIHDSMRGYFGYELYKKMMVNNDIWIITADLGYGMFDPHKEDFSDRFINVCAAEQTTMNIAIGLALSGKIPFVYSITPFLLWRAAEQIRLYVDHENIPVKLIGSGRDDDYKHDGFSHNAEDAQKILTVFDNIIEYWPEDKVEMARVINEMTENLRPSFLSLKR